MKSPLNITNTLGKYTLHDTSQDTEIETRSANSTESLSLPIINGSTNFNKDNQKLVSMHIITLIQSITIT